MYWIGNKSLLFVGVTLGALGMVLVFQPASSQPHHG